MYGWSEREGKARYSHRETTILSPARVISTKEVPFGTKSRSARGLFAILSLCQIKQVIRSSSSLPRESLPQLFQSGFFALETVPIMDKGVAKLSRMAEAVWLKSVRDGRR